MVYLDNAGTTKPYDEVVEKFSHESREEYFNISAIYQESFDLSKRVDEARRYFLSIIGGREGDRIIFTSGATEANNIAILGSSQMKNKRFLFSSGEHPSVYNTAIFLKSQGYNVDFIPIQRNGQVDYDALDNMCDSEVCFISTMLVSNETGAINDIEKIAHIVKAKSPKAIIHVDGVQALGKISIDVKKCHIDLLSMSSHKIGGLKGCGALYVSSNVNLKPTYFGGGQEYGIRSGTVNASAVLSFQKALEMRMNNLEQNYKKAEEIKNYLLERVKKYKNVIVTSCKDGSPYIISLLFKGNRGETIQRFLSSRGILVGTGSACSSKKVGNRVLQEMGYTKDEILGAIRISLFDENTKEHIDSLISALDKYFEKINT